ncbi:MAG: hypothetical protein JWQ40_2649 [Segetibacter sp.]|nr:hypothetical protein [Segetibacter sp.]
MVRVNSFAVKQKERYFRYPTFIAIAETFKEDLYV